jgi:penicillin-binding protein 1A
LTHSRNLVSIRLLRDITADYAIDYAKRFGFDTNQMPHNLSLALGSGSAAPWDMARAYASLANGGYRIEPYIIQRIEDVDGNILQQAQPHTVCETCLVIETENGQDNDEQIYGFTPAKRIITPQNAYIMNSLLRDVVRFGTGRKAMSLGRQDLAGKTGTTNDQVDAWFNGFHPSLVAISWVGFDNPRTLGRFETGGKAALPMWMDFMKVALKNVPEQPLELPADMVTVKINPDTGLLAMPDEQNAIYESFRKEYVPTQFGDTFNANNKLGTDNGSTPIIDLF